MSRSCSKSACTSVRRQLYMAVLGAMSSSAYALPQGGNVTVGDASISNSGNVMTVEQASDRAVLQFDSFNVDASETVNFVQPSSNSVTLNRVLGSDLSEIHGSINANGHVYLINPNGVLFGAGAEVNVSGLVATTLDMSDENFIKHRERLRGTGEGMVENRGRINASDRVVLIAADVTNRGEITAPGGEVMLRSGRDVLLHSPGSEIPILMEDPGLVGQVVNEGTISAGRVALVLDGQNRRDAYDNAINNSGIIRAVAATGEGGSIELFAPGGDAINTGSLDASAVAGSGGDVHVSAERFGQTGETRADGVATGSGGEINIKTEDTIVLHADSQISANGGAVGDGGDVIVYADNATWYREGSRISARGGAQSGDGGFVEVSGRNTVVVESFADVGATNGQGGLWYIDPTDISIGVAASNSGSFILADGTYLWDLVEPASVSSSIRVNDILNALRNGDVYIDTASAASADGHINVQASIDYNGVPIGQTLTLRADGDITFQGGTFIGDSAPGDEGINLVMDAGGFILLNSSSYIDLGSGSLSAVAAEHFNILGDAYIAANGATINAGTTITMGSGAGSYIDAGAGMLELTAAGDITITDILSSSASDTAVVLRSLNGALLDDGNAATGITNNNGGVLLSAATSIGTATSAFGFNTDVVGIELTSANGVVNISNDASLTITSIRMGANSTFDFSAVGDITFTGSVSGDLDGANGSTLNLNAGGALNFTGSLADMAGADDNVTMNFTAGSGFSVADGVLIHSGAGQMDINVTGVGDATVTGLTSLSALSDAASPAISINLANGQVIDGGDTNADITAPNGLVVINAPGGVAGLDTDLSRVQIDAGTSDISLSDAGDLTIASLIANIVTLDAVGDLFFPADSIAGTTSVFASAGGTITVPDGGLVLVDALSLTANDIDNVSGTRDLLFTAPTLVIDTAAAVGDLNISSTTDSLSVANRGASQINIADVDALTLVSALPVSGSTSVSSGLNSNLTIANASTVDLNGASGTLALSSGNDLHIDIDIINGMDSMPTLQLNAANNVTFASTAQVDVGAGDLSINAASGNVVLGQIAGTAVSVNAGASISDANGIEQNLTANTASLTAVGDIGSAADAIDGAVAALTLDAGNVYYSNAMAMSLAVAAAAELHVSLPTAGDLTLLDAAPAISGSSHFEVGAGDLILPSAGFTTAGDVTVDALAIRGLGAGALMQARDASLTLADGGNATSLDVDFDSLVLQVAGTQAVNIDDVDELTVAGVTARGELTLGTVGDLNITDTAADFGTDLTLSTAGDLTVASGILAVPGTLTITARNLSDGDSVVNLTATTAVLDLAPSAPVTLATTIANLDFSSRSTAPIIINEADGVGVNALTAMGDVDINTAAGNIGFATDAITVSGTTSLMTAGDGQVNLSDTGLRSNGALRINAAALRDSDNMVELAGTSGDITLRNATGDLQWNTTFDTLLADVRGDLTSLTVMDADGLAVNGLTSAANTTVSTTDADLTLSSTLNVTGALAVSTIGSGDVVVPEAGLIHSGALSITADNIRDADGDVTMAATDASINLRDGAVAGIWRTAFNTLTASVAGGGGVDIVDSDALTLLGFISGGAGSVSTSGADLTLTTAPTVAGELALSTIGSGDVVLADTGLIHSGALSISADNLRDSDSEVAFSATEATVALRDGATAQTWLTTVETLNASVAGAGPLTVTDADALNVAQLSTGGAASIAATAADLTVTATPTVAGALTMSTLNSGDVVVAETGLMHSGALTIVADNLRDVSDSDTSLGATDAAITLRDGATSQTWSTAFDTLAANIAGGGALTVADSDALTIAGLTTGGAADITATSANLTVIGTPSVGGNLRLATTGSGEVVLPSTGLSHAGLLELNAAQISDGDNSVILAADDLLIRQRQAGMDTVFNTTAGSLDLVSMGSGAVTVVEADALELLNLAVGADASVATAGDLSIVGATAVPGLLTLRTEGAGRLISTDAGIATAGDLRLDVAAWQDSDNRVLLSASTAEIQLRDQQQALTLTSDVSVMDLNHAAASDLNIVQATDLTINQLSSGGNVSIGAGSNLTLVETAPSIAGALALQVFGTLTIADQGLQVPGALSVDAANLASIGGSGATVWQADSANLHIRNSAQSGRISTLVNQLSLSYDGAAPLSAAVQSGTGISGLTASGDLNIESAGALRMLTAVTSVNGTLTLQASGDVELSGTGLTVADNLRISSNNLRSASGGPVVINGNRADISLTGSAGLSLQSQLAELGLDYASAQALSVVNDGNLSISRWQADNAANIGFTVAGHLAIPDAGLAAANSLRIDATDLTDSDRILNLSAPQLQVRLSGASGNNLWNITSNEFDALLRGQADLQVSAADGLALQDLNGDGQAIDIANGNFALDLANGDLQINSNVFASGQTADGQRGGIIDIAVAQGDIQVGLSSDVAIVSTNTGAHTSASSAGGQNGIRMLLGDTSSADRRIALGDGRNFVELRAVGGDIALSARPAGTSAAATREIVQSAGLTIAAYNQPGDAQTGDVTNNGATAEVQPWQQIGEGRTLALVSDVLAPPDLGSVLDEIDDIGDNIVALDQPQKQGSDASEQFDAVFGRCDELDQNGGQQCRVNAALKAFLSHWLVGGEMPPKTEI